MSAVFILLAVGALIGTWNMAGTIPTVVYYGVGCSASTWFYPATAIICGARRARHRQLVDDGRDARRRLRGARAAARRRPGDHRRRGHLGRLLRRQDDADLGDDRARPVDGRRRDHPGAHRRDDLDVGPGDHPRARRLRDPRPRRRRRPTSASTRPPPRRRSPASSGSRRSTCCRWSCSSSSPSRRAPPFLSIFGSALFAAVLAWFTQPRRRGGVRRPAGRRPARRPSIEAIYTAMANGFVSNTGNETIDALFSRGGMDSMLTTIWLVLGALSFAAIMEDAGLPRAPDPAGPRRAKSTGRLIASVIATCIGLNIIAGDQYVAIVMPSRSTGSSSPSAASRRGCCRGRSRTRAPSRRRSCPGTAAAPTWRASSASPRSPTCRSLLQPAQPVISLIYGFTGFRIEHIAADRRRGRAGAPIPAEAA